MQKRRTRWATWLVPGTAALALGLMAPATAGAQALVRVGGEFGVNTYTTGYQKGPSVAADADGDFVVVWGSAGSSGTDTDGFSVQGQRYASNGSTQGGEFQVNAYTTSGQGVPSVAANPDGDFVVVWASAGSFGTDTSGASVQGQRYVSDGSTQGAQFQVNTYTTNYQSIPSVKADADGDFVVVWNSKGSSGSDTDSWSVQAQRYASNGSTQGAEFQVNTYTTGRQLYPSVAADADGDFVVVWESYGSSGTDTSASSIQGQRYASDGSTQGAQFEVNTYTSSYQNVPSVAVDADGDFVVAWGSWGSSGTDTDGMSTQGQRYTSDGSTQGAQFQVNTYTTHYQGRPSVAVDADGDFVVAWQSYSSYASDTDNLSIQGQRYASDGSTQGAQFQVNTYTTNGQYEPSVAVDAGGDVVVVWESKVAVWPATVDYSISGQRYRLAPPVPAMSPATRFALAVALLLLGTAYALRRRS